MSFTTAAISSIKQNRKLTQFRARYKRHESLATIRGDRLGPRTNLSQAGERRVRSQEGRNLARDLLLLAIALGSTSWILNTFIS